MAKVHKGFYNLKDPSKYIGNNPPYYRSSWEFQLMHKFDTSTAIKEWSSEPIKLKYLNPLKQRYSWYVPDFFVVYIDKNNKQHRELIEVKPLKESSIVEAKSERDKINCIINDSKWRVAKRWCQERGIVFRVITERELHKK